MCLSLKQKIGLCTNVINLGLSPFKGIIISPTLSMTSTLLFPLYTITGSYSIFYMQLFLSKILIRAYYQSDYKKPSLVSWSHSQVISFAASVKAIYLVLVDKKIIVSYLFKYQLTELPLSIKIKLKVDFQLFLFLPNQNWNIFPLIVCSCCYKLFFIFLSLLGIAKLLSHF